MATAVESTTGNEVEVHDLTDEETRALLDQQAHEALGMSWDEFARAWDAGELGSDWDDKPAVRWLAMLLPLGR